MFVKLLITIAKNVQLSSITQIGKPMTKIRKKQLRAIGLRLRMRQKSKRERKEFKALSGYMEQAEGKISY